MRFEDWLKALPQTLHLWGFSPEKLEIHGIHLVFYIIELV